MAGYLLELLEFGKLLLFRAGAHQVLGVAISEYILLPLQEFVLLDGVKLEGGISIHPEPVLVFLNHILPQAPHPLFVLDVEWLD